MTPQSQLSQFSGIVNGGRQPIECATVTAYAAATTPGAAPTELGHDKTRGPGCHSNSTGSAGTFNITIAPGAVTSGQVVYAIATGGVSVDSPGASSNPATGLMTVAGVWGSPLAPVPNTVNINELTTVASVAALRDYIDFRDCTAIIGTSRSGRCLLLPGAIGLAGAAAKVTALVNVTSGQPSDFLDTRRATPTDPVYVTLQKLDALASILAGCVNTSATGLNLAPACLRLFKVALARPRTTLEATYDIAAWPGVNAKSEALYALLPSAPIYSPPLPLGAAPLNWTIAGERFVYASDTHSGKLSAWRLSSLTGIFTPVTAGSVGACSSPGWPIVPDPKNCFAAGHSPTAMALDPVGRFVWAIDGSNGAITTYSIDPATGALVAGNSITDANGPAALAVNPSATRLYVANKNVTSISVYTINSADGSLIALSAPFPTSATAGALAVTRDGNHLYATSTNDDRLSTYPIVANGSLGTALAPTPITAPGALALNPTAPYLYIVTQSGVSAFKIQAGAALSALGAVATIPDPVSMTIDHTGRFAYVTSQGSGGHIYAYRTGLDGTLTQVSGSPFPAGNAPAAVVTDATGHFVYAINQTGNNVSAWTITTSGSTAGALTPIHYTAPYPAGTYTDAIVVDPTGRFAYAVNTNCHTNMDHPCPSTTGSVSAWRVDAASGALIPLAGAPYPAGTSPELLAIDPSGRSLYVANRGSAPNAGSVMAWRIDARSGALTLIGTYTNVGSGPYGITVAPDGKHVYSANYDGGSMTLFTRHLDGTLTAPITSPTSGSGPLSLAVDPGGQFLFSANHASDDISAYSLDPTTGAPINITGSPFPASASTDWVVVTPTGAHVYAANDTGHNVSAYTVKTTGALSSIGPFPMVDGAGTAPVRALAMDPFGRFLYSANHGANNIGAWQILADGTLQPIAGAPFSAGQEPLAITVDPSGHFVYTANHTGGDVSAFTIEFSGILAPVAASSPFQTGAHPSAIVTSR